MAASLRECSLLLRLQSSPVFDSSWEALLDYPTAVSAPMGCNKWSKTLVNGKTRWNTSR